MATNIVNSRDDDENTLKQDIIEKQVTLSELLHYMTTFSCVTCAWEKVPERSPEYLITMNKMKRQFLNLMGLMRDFYADWPIQCDCMIQLHFPLNETFRMAEYLFHWYPNAYNIDIAEEAEAIKLYDAIFKDAYKFHALCCSVLKECLQSHTFLEEYPFSQHKCTTCRFKGPENFLDSDSSNDSEGQPSETHPNAEA